MLQNEVQTAQQIVRTDAYQMSFGEIVSMYKDGELIINPDFQRLFRWEIGQKSKLIESLLLGIPVPSIFVFETENSKWELIDGLQRISTILEFMGLLRDPDTRDPVPPSALVATKYLPSLNNMVWEKSKRIVDVPFDEQVELDRNLQLSIRRARVGVEILKRPSDNKTKYDLFQRLNAGGTPANAQELRNCVIVMVNGAYFRFVKELADDDGFRTVLSPTEDQIERQRHIEYTTRFLVHCYIPYDGKLDVEEYIDEGIIRLATASEITETRIRFVDTFALLNRTLGADALRRYEDGRHVGRVGLVAFECIAIGIGKNIDAIRALPDADAFVRSKVMGFWNEAELQRFLSPGLRGTARIQRTIPFGQRWFRP